MLGLEMKAFLREASERRACEMNVVFSGQSSSSNFSPHGLQSQIMRPNTSIQTFMNVDELIDSAKRSFIERGRFLIMLSGGTTPLKLYEKLAQEKPTLSNVAGLDWTRVHFFWGDE